MTKCDEYQSILSTVIYFDIFKYPLTLEEIICFSDSKLSSSSLKQGLNILVEEKKIYQFGEYYSLKDTPLFIEQRVECNKRALQKLITAKKYSRALSKIPFVKCVCLSGSISKGVMHKDSDIDYFVITESEMVWITKFLTVVYRLLFLFNKRAFFCVNYIIDEDYLEIEEQNRFTATEIVTMIPTKGFNTYKKFRLKNEWAKSYFPNFPLRNAEFIDEKPTINSFSKLLIRILFDNFFGKIFGKIFMHLSWFRYKQKFKGKMKEDSFNIAFKTNDKVSKSHGPNFQKVVEEQLLKKITSFEKEHKYKFQGIIF